MTVQPESHDHLSDYERAVCYHNLPRTNNSLTMGLITAYLVCIAEALGAIFVGVYFEKPDWLRFGAIAFVALIVFGIVAFTIRAFVAEPRAPGALCARHRRPRSAQIFPTLADHILLRHPAHARGAFQPDRQSRHERLRSRPTHHRWWARRDWRVIRVVAGGGGKLPDRRRASLRARVFRAKKSCPAPAITLSDLEVGSSPCNRSGRCCS